MLKKLLGLDSSQEVDKIELAFRGGWPFGIILVLAAITLAVYLYRRERLIPRNRRIAMMCLQAAALLTFIVVIMQPFAKIRTTNEFKRSMIVMKFKRILIKNRDMSQKFWLLSMFSSFLEIWGILEDLWGNIT